MPRIGLPELIIILVVVFVIFGAGRLPQVGGALGKAIREFRKEKTGGDGEAPKRKRSAKKAATKEQQS